MTTRDELIDWLRDAYAMERGLEVTLKHQAESDELLPSMRDMAESHLAETRRHAEAVKMCLERLGSDVSTIKTGLAQVMESMKGFGMKFASDERVKHALASYAMEHFEIACYKALRSAANSIGESGIVEVCDTIIPDEERMARWLDENLPIVVNQYLAERTTR
jgi:ferritin-like metal-binding protein YciE